MKFTKFIIKNFKGIKKTELKFNQLGQGKAFTLVGLNECGKTTILEAINSFSPDLEVERIFHSDVFKKIEHRDLIDRPGAEPPHNDRTRENPGTINNNSF